MSKSIAKKHSDLRRIGIALLIIALVFVALFAFTGCATTSAVAEPDPAASSATTPSEEPKQEPPALPVFGETNTYSDGLSISVSAPADYQPSDVSSGAVDGQASVVFEFVLTNGSTENFDPTLVIATASSAGTEASGIFDVGNDIGFPPSTVVLPGATIKWQQAFSVANPADITMEVTVGFTHDPTIFVSAK